VFVGTWDRDGHESRPRVRVGPCFQDHMGPQSRGGSIGCVGRL
jgi:hypothetical protein